MSSLESLDEFFECRGGFQAAYTKLVAYANHQIARRSGKHQNGLVVANLDPCELVDHAMARLFKADELPANGEDAYRQLRRHINNFTRGVQKKVIPPHLRISGGENNIFDFVDDVEDKSASNPLSEIEKREDNEACLEILKRTKSEFKSSRLEYRLLELLAKGQFERKENIRILRTPDTEYDKAWKRVGRKIQAAKTKYLKEFPYDYTTTELPRDR